MRRIPSHLALLSTAFVCILALTACGSSAPVLQYVTISPTSANAIAGSCGGDIVNFTASAYYSDGSIKDGTSLVTWSSSNPTVATIAAGGVATAVGAGTATITATAAGTPGATATLTVTAASATNLAITPTNVAVPLGSAMMPTTEQYKLTGTLSSGATEDLTTTATWASSNTAVATIGANTGLATTVSAGTTNISATIYCTTVPPAATPNVLTVTPAAPVALNILVSPAMIPVAAANLPATVTVPVGGTQQFTVQEVWSDGRTPTVASNPSTLVFTISPTTAPIPAAITTSGLATALLAGTSTVDATEMVVSGTTTFTIGSTSTGGTSATMTVVPAVARFAYVANISDSSISAFSVNGSSGTPNGTFTPLGKFSEGNQPVQVVPHPSGLFLYSIGSDANQTVTLFKVDPVAGGLTNSGKSYATTTTAPAGPSIGAMDAGGNFLFVVSPLTGVAGSGQIQGFTINQTDGTLTPVATTTTNLSDPTFILIDNNGPYLYAINNGNKTVSGYTINTATNAPQPGPTGTLTPISGTGGTVTLTSTDISNTATIDPTGSFIYVPAGNSTVEGVAIGTGGALSKLTGTPFAVAGSTFTAVALVDPTSKFLYVLDSPGSGNGKIFTLPLTSGIPGAVSSSVSVGSNPVWIAEDSSGSVVAAVNNSDNTISSFTVGTGGALTSTGLTQVASGPGLLTFYNGTAEPTVAPAEVVAANSGSGNVAAFVAGTGGVLTADASNPYATFAGDDFVATSSLAGLVVTGGTASNLVAAYTAAPANASASPATPTLTAVTGSPFTIPTASARPTAVAIDTTGQFVFAADTANGQLYGFNGTSAAVIFGPILTGVKAIAVDPQSTLIYGLANGSITPVLFSSIGQTASVSTTPLVQAGNWTVAAVDATGRYLVAFDSTAKAFSTFTIIPVSGAGATSTDGTLTLLHTDSAITGNVTSFAFDPTGHYIVIADAVANTVTAYSFTPSGTANNLTALTGTAVITLPTAPGGSPAQIAFDASGQYLFVALSGVASGTSMTAGAVAVYTTNVASGVPAFKAVTGSPFAAGTTTTGLNTLGVGVIDSVQ
jgi:6-phosphogluconolactonase (cycloisomerase 2 family)